MEPWMVALLSISVVALIVLGARMLKRRVTRDNAEEKELEVLHEKAQALLDATNDSILPEDRKALTTREARDLWVKERQATKLCRYCEEKAIEQMPTFKPIRPMFDGLLRYLNATPNNRWKIVLTRDPSIEKELCEKHHEQVRGLFEEKVAKERSEYTKFVGDQRLDIYEFERYYADERMQEDMQAIRRGKKKTPKLAEVVKLQPAKRTGNGEG